MSKYSFLGKSLAVKQKCTVGQKYHHQRGSTHSAEGRSLLLLNVCIILLIVLNQCMIGISQSTQFSCEIYMNFSNVEVLDNFILFHLWGSSSYLNEKVYRGKMMDVFAIHTH